jgi:hypothetical protein
MQLFRFFFVPLHRQKENKRKYEKRRKITYSLQQPHETPYK